MQYIRFLAAFLVYAVIDIAWNVSPIARGMYESLYEASGNDALLDQFGRQMDTWGPVQGLALLAFFGLIALGNSYLAIEPAVKENSLHQGGEEQLRPRLRGLRHVHRADLPDDEDVAHAILVPIDILIGGLLSLITSTVVTYVVLRRRNRAESSA